MKKVLWMVCACGMLMISCSQANSKHDEKEAKEPFKRGPVKSSWDTPVIKNYGKEHYLPGAAVQPDTSLDYKVVFSITEYADKTQPNEGLVHMARLINLLGAAGVSPDKMDIVAVITGPATFATLADSTYKSMYDVDNPNDKLLDELKRDGHARILVCGQAVTGAGYDERYLNPNVEMALSAVVAVPTYELKGYALLNF